MTKQSNTVSQENRKKGEQHSHGGNNRGQKAAETRGHASLAEAGRKGGKHSHRVGKPESQED